MNDPKCKHCPGYENCEWRCEEDDSCWYEPPGDDYSTAWYKELKAQNGEDY